MVTHELINCFGKNHLTLIDFVNKLSKEAFNFSYGTKWTAGQQLHHCYICLLPFPKILTSKDYIIKKFGNINRPVLGYDSVIENYTKTNLKAPDEFFPKEIAFQEKGAVITDFKTIIETIQVMLKGYSDAELDGYVIPHPLLGRLTIKELFYVMSYHPLHHLEQIKIHLKHFNL